MATSKKRIRYTQDKAIVTAIGYWQSGAAERVPTSDMIQLCSVLRAECAADYLAQLVCDVELGTSLKINLFLDLDLDGMDLGWSEYIDEYNSAVLRCVEERAEEWQAKFVGGFEGSNVIDLKAARLLRGLPAAARPVVA